MDKITQMAENNEMEIKLSKCSILPFNPKSGKQDFHPPIWHKGQLMKVVEETKGSPNLLE